VVSASVGAFLILAAVLTIIVPGAVTEMFPPRSTSLLRTWTCRYPYATEMIALKPAGACVQSIAFDSGRVISNISNWSFDPSDGEVRLNRK
jgi:hypothetical protein